MTTPRRNATAVPRRSLHAHRVFDFQKLIPSPQPLLPSRQPLLPHRPLDHKLLGLGIEHIAFSWREFRQVDLMFTDDLFHELFMRPRSFAVGIQGLVVPQW